MLILVLVLIGSAAAAGQQNQSTVERNLSPNPSNQGLSEGTSDTLNITGYWVNDGSALDTMNVSALRDEGVTDLFIATNKENVNGSLTPFINKFSGSGIRIHAWLTCFIDSNGNWYDPGTNPSLVDGLTSSITSISTNYDVEGIHLDYVRYPGTEGNEAFRYDGTTHVTSFVANIYSIIQDINSQNTSGKPHILLSAALMPECNINAYYYGQDYGQLAPYLDFMVPMIYKGNYAKNTSWITSTTQYIVEAANGTPVVAGLQTYRSDNYLVPIPLDELNLDIQAALSKGSSGYMLFRYGLTYTTVIPYSYTEIAEIINAAAWVKNFIEEFETLPSKVTMNSTIGTEEIDMPTFLYLLSKGLLYIYNGDTGSIGVTKYNNPTNPSKTLNNGSILKNEYIDIAKRVLNFMNTGRAPNYATSSVGNIQYENLIKIYSNILNIYLLTGFLPDYLSLNDTTSPTVTKTDPTNNATNIPANQVITVTFNENIKTGTSWIELIKSGGESISFTLTINGNTLTIKPKSNLTESKYTLILHTGSVIDMAGNPLALNSFTFTVDTTPPIVTGTAPSSNATKIQLTAPVIITFSENIKTGSNYSGIYIKNTVSGVKVAINTTINGNTLTIQQTTSKLYSTPYQVYIPAGAITDSTGNSLSVVYTYNFTTVPQPDTTPPRVNSTDPLNNAVNVPAGKVIKVIFSENIKVGTGWIELLKSNTAIPFTSSINGNVLTITPTINLIEAKYKVIMHTRSVTDMAGNPLAVNSFTFSVKTPPTVTKTNPASNAVKIPVTANVIITFSENIKAGTNYSGIYIKNTKSGVKVAITKTISGKNLTIKQTTNRLYNTPYQVYIPTGAIKDTTGNNLAKTHTYKFTTATKTTDNTPPKITKTNPAKNANKASRTAPITLTFSENIKAGTNYSGIYIKNLSTGKKVSFSKNISGKNLTLKMVSNRLSKNTYQVYLPAKAVKDANGNNLASAYTYKFITI